MKKTTIVLISIGSLIIIIGLLFISGIIQLEFIRFFKPKFESVERNVFEETKSYVHGAIQDIAKYYQEYQSTDNKEVIENVIKMRFSEFDAEKIKSSKLRSWFVEIRGY